MSASALFIITGDPRLSPRPAEALRIAAGIGAWKKAVITVFLLGPAVLALSEFTDDFVDQDNYERYLPLLGESGRPIYVPAGEPLLALLSPPRLPCEPIGPDRLAELAAQANYVLRF